MNILRTRRIPLSLALLLPMAAHAGSNTLADMISKQGSTGFGAVGRVAYWPYAGAPSGPDLIPLYMYEGERFFLHGTRAGIKFQGKEHSQVQVFLDYRDEGYPVKRPSAALAGMQERKPSLDYGVSYRFRNPFGNIDLELLGDAGNTHDGLEARAEYSFDLDAGRWHLRPAISVQRRNAKLNNYYYGVAPWEATSERPAYNVGASTDWSLNLYGNYELTERMRALAALGLTKHSGKILNSPIVKDKLEPTLQLGMSYDFGGREPIAKNTAPLYLRILAGRETPCRIQNVMTLRCMSISSQDETRIYGFNLTRPLIEGVNSWPLDIVASMGVIRHDERSIQPSTWQVNGLIKAYYYGFPWRDQIHMRAGLGMGISVAQRVPLTEVRKQSLHGGHTSHLLNCLDPTIDVSIGDLLGVKTWKKVYLGLGVSHRSGIFGTSRLLRNVNGGRDYIYTYIESRL